MIDEIYERYLEDEDEMPSNVPYEEEFEEREESLLSLNKCKPEQHKEVVAIDIENGEHEILTCTICLCDDSEILMICRFCGNNACNSCWNRVINQRSKCFFCRKRINKRDLVRNLIAERIRYQQRILASQNDNKPTKKCPEHDKPGRLFCETCSCFFCFQCIKESVHSGHKVCDIEENPKIKNKILETNKYCNELEKGRNLLLASVKEHSELIDISQSDLDIYVAKLKDKIFKRIDEDTKNLREILLLEASLNTQAKTELDKFDDVVKDLETLNLRTIDVEKLRTSINKQVENDQAPNVKALIDTKDLELCKNSIQERYLLGCDSTNHTKFSEFMKKTLKEGTSQFV
ncbi:unnamed protein product [Moneuplotes crassus]|uniref:B box-type domain-containing protein n=1 Tax=Euplotes crassus TaxID=5936 RepID=A0AAD1UKD3_EUPCR|nr:unnamed protein product [Moneuplotes crassus]